MKVLMVSTEYPPMKGGVGRYAANLVSALRRAGGLEEVCVACSSEGGGEFGGISPTNQDNSSILLRIVQEYRPDVVHVQFEPGLYGLVLDPGDPARSMTYIDSFYEKCRVPIVTTFHSAYTFAQWMGQATIVKRTGRTGRLGIPARAAVKTWKCFLNYKAFHGINRDKLRRSSGGIALSQYMADRIGGGDVIYHGAEPALPHPPPSKAQARKRFSLPKDGKIALAVGFGTATKGWDILGKMKAPDGWTIVLNSSKGHFNKEQDLDVKMPVTVNNHGSINSSSRERGNNSDSNSTIDLQKGFLGEEDLSMLLLASDAVLLPYKITSGSGVMFDALAHGLPFVASDLEFFREFANRGLGITARRDPDSFARALSALDRNYHAYSKAVEGFKPRLRWDSVAEQHIRLYREAVLERKGMASSAAAAAAGRVYRRRF